MRALLHLVSTNQAAVQAKRHDCEFVLRQAGLNLKTFQSKRGRRAGLTDFFLDEVAKVQD